MSNPRTAELDTLLGSNPAERFLAAIGSLLASAIDAGAFHELRHEGLRVDLATLKNAKPHGWEPLFGVTAALRIAPQAAARLPSDGGKSLKQELARQIGAYAEP